MSWNKSSSRFTQTASERIADYEGGMMHYVNLKVDETFKIVNEAGEEIEVRLVEIKSNWEVRLGITAPRSIRVLRSELLEREPGVSAP